MNITKVFGVLLSLILIVACQKEGVKVTTAEEFQKAVKMAKPGDVIIMASQTWNNVELKFDAIGTKEQPIVLKAENKGEVFIEGQSRLIIGGEHLVIEGLVFRNGFSPTSEVISFKKKKGQYGNNCRLTECVIDNFNGSERHETNHWVAIYGKNNRVDHCYLVDKRTKGVTMTVRMVDEACRNNNHRIDHNYFGMRQNFGGNGGETLRLGTSHYSLSTCGAIVENNLFEYCDGEIEIISNKSCGNKFLNNTFKESRGTLTFRHGNDNIAEGNFFIGNGKPHVGGVRIINKRNKAINNYFSDIIGYRFGGAMVIMNGVPNSKINRYHQVDGGEFRNNSFVNCDNILLCAGSDDERSAVPINSVIENNLFVHNSKENIFTIFDDISGIRFKNNYASSNLNNAQISFKAVDFSKAEFKNGIYQNNIPELKGVGCSLTKEIANANNTGVNWYSKQTRNRDFGVGKEIKVPSGMNTLQEALYLAESGDVLVLSAGAEYTMDKKFAVNFPVSIVTEGGGDKPVIMSSKEEMITIENEGALKLKGIEINGGMSPDAAGNAVIATSHYSMNCNYKLIVEDCEVKDMNVNHSFDFLRAYPTTMADSVVIRNSKITNLTGSVLRLDKETADLGFFNAEYVILENSQFKNIGQSALTLYRGGTDESSFGPHLEVDNCNFNNVGKDKRNKCNASIAIHGVQVTHVSNSTFTNSADLNIRLTLNAEPITVINSAAFNNTSVISNSNEFKMMNSTRNGKKYVFK